MRRGLAVDGSVCFPQELSIEFSVHLGRYLQPHSVLLASASFHITLMYLQVSVKAGASLPNGLFAQWLISLVSPSFSFLIEYL